MLVAPRIFSSTFHFHDFNHVQPQSSSASLRIEPMFELVLEQECTVSMLRYIVHSEQIENVRGRLRPWIIALGFHPLSEKKWIPLIDLLQHRYLLKAVKQLGRERLWFPKFFTLWQICLELPKSKRVMFTLAWPCFNRALSEHNGSDCCVCEAQLWVQCIPVSTLMCGAHATHSRLWAELTKTSAPCGALMPAWTCLNLPACLQVQADLEKSHQTISELTLAELTVS